MPARDKRKLTKDEEGSAKASKPAPKASEAKKRKAGSPEAKPASVGKSKAKAASVAKSKTKSASVAKSEAKPASVAKSKAGAADKVLFTRWLMKSEPDSRLENGVDVKFGVDDLEASPNQTAPWDGVRNYQVLIQNVHPNDPSAKLYNAPRVRFTHNDLILVNLAMHYY